MTPPSTHAEPPEDGLLQLGPDHRLYPEDVVAASYQARPALCLSEAATQAIISAHAALERLVEQGREIYGLTTGFGPFVACRASTDPSRQGLGLINHLASGWGDPAPAEIVRAAMILRAQTVAQGFSGIEPRVAEAFVELITAGVAPAVPEIGSVGASGDLIPLAHVVQCLAGRGEALDAEDALVPAAKALASAGLEPTELGARDALSLVNGTAFMTAYAVHALIAAERVLDRAEELTAWIYRLFAARTQPLDDRLHSARGHAGQRAAAARITGHIDAHGGVVPDEHRPLQEVYSVRCAPQWLGAAREQLAHARRLIEVEINGISDNPVVIAANHAHGTSDDVIHGGNFQGTQIAFATDAINTALVHTALLAERQIDVLSNPELNMGAPLLLAREPGPDAGIAGVQITATALVAEMRLGAQPAAIASIPTNGRNQDVVSMGTVAARNAHAQVDRAAGVLAACALAAAQLDHRRRTGLAPGPSADGPRWAEVYTPFEADRPTRRDLQRLSQAILTD